MRRLAIVAGGVVLTACFVWFTMRWFQGRILGEAFSQLLRSPGMLLFMTAGYGMSFWLKALAWRLYAGRERTDPLRNYLHPLFVSLLVNHLLPVKAGDLARVGLYVRDAKVRWDDALHSVAAMRVLDMASLLLIGSAGALILGLEASPWYLAVLGVGALAAGLLLHGLERMRRSAQRSRNGYAGGADFGDTAPIRRVEVFKTMVLRQYDHFRTTLASKRGAAAALLTFAGWLLEGTVVYGVAHALGLAINPLQAIWVTGMTIAGQVFHVTPGGIGTYETTLTASLAVLGIAGSAAYSAALLSHGYKFVFAYVTGAASFVMTSVTWTEIRGWMRLRGREGQGE